MRGLLTDVNVQGHLAYLVRLLSAAELLPFLNESGIELVTFRDLNLHPETSDRELWELCQRDGWVLLTENRNHDGPDSLGITIAESWQPGHLPVLTLSNKTRFERDPRYAQQVANDVAELLYGIQVNGEYRESPRINVPTRNIEGSRL